MPNSWIESRSRVRCRCYRPGDPLRLFGGADLRCDLPVARFRISAFLSNCMEELLQFFKNEKENFGYSRINLTPGQRFFDLIWEFPIQDHSHGAFGQNEPRQSKESPEVGLRWEWRDVGHFFKEEGPLLMCAYVLLNRGQEFNLEEEDLFLLEQEHNPLLYVNTDNLRDNVKKHVVDQNLIKRLREGTSRGKQIWDAFNAGCYFLGIDPYAEVG
jgi:hypothetical protein